jgi:hypothetical protein
VLQLSYAALLVAERRDGQYGLRGIDHQSGREQALRQETIMQWTLRGAHLLLQTWTKVLNDELDEVFRRWYPKFRPQTREVEAERKAA